MAKFLFQLAVFASLVVGGYVLIFNITPVNTGIYSGFSYNFMSGIQIKHQRANSIKTPKVLFVGGSSNAYGIDSKKMEDHISVPVVNLGHHAGLGVPFILDQAKKLMREGDIVFLCLEYLMGSGDYRLIEETCSVFPEVADLGKYDVRKEIQAHLSETRIGLAHWVKGDADYSSLKDRATLEDVISSEYDGVSNFNKYGDFIGHLDQQGYYKFPFAETKVQYRYWSEIELMNRFKAEAEEVGVDVYFSYPPIARTMYDKNAGLLEKIGKDLQNNLEIEIINTKEQLVFDESYFYDTEYHLTYEGRDVRMNMFFETIAKNKNTRASVIRAAKAQKR